MKTSCTLCPHHCALAPGQTGRCHARRNIDGKVTCINHSRITALALDPIEKKPLYRFHPGTKVLSVGSFGCNLSCPWCQNHTIATSDGHSNELQIETIGPAQIARYSLELVPEGNIGIAYTYNEPFIMYEFVRDCAQLVHDQGQYNIVVSNGMVCEEPLRELLPLIDALNIDLKGFTQDFYDLCSGDLETVKRTIEVCHESAHVEVTTLVIPELNDDPDQVEKAARWLAGLDPEIPYHLSRFFPCHLMNDRGPTPLDTLEKLAERARRHLRHVYLGNV